METNDDITFLSDNHSCFSPQFEQLAELLVATNIGTTRKRAEQILDLICRVEKVFLQMEDMSLLQPFQRAIGIAIQHTKDRVGKELLQDLLRDYSEEADGN